MKHNKTICYILALLVALSVEAFGRVTPRHPSVKAIPNENCEDLKLEKAVEEALAAIHKKAPWVHESALKTWKNFKGNARRLPHYTYRFWGIEIILWLKEHKNMVFSSGKKVYKVFQILNHKGIISKHAVLVLSQNVWSYLVQHEGAPDWDKSEDQSSAEEFGDETA